MKRETPLRVLLIDDDDTFRTVLASELTRRGFSVDSARNGREGIERGARREADVILLDLRLPDMGGIEVLNELRRLEVPAGVVVLTGHGTIDTAIQAIRLGAHDYLEKPCPIKKVEMTLEKTSEHLGLLARQRVLQDGFSPPDVRPAMVGSSAEFLRLCEVVRRFARTDATTLILGETGVGKDLIAKYLHAQSPRSQGPFVVVDCASLHEDLLQSELFGHEKGAFSGADRRKHGLFEVAEGGTLFLDEVGELSLETQSKLLRAIESRKIRRVGGNEEIDVGVRIVAATNRDLAQGVARGRFREDLYFRLSTLTVEVPPLRRRREDVPMLVEHYTERFNRRFGRSVRVGSQALRRLLEHAWPGNVRELVHVLEQAIVLCEGEEIRPEDLALPARGGEAEPVQGPVLTLRALEERHVRDVLERVSGNRARAASLLGISERNLYRWIRRLSASEPETAADGNREGSP